MTTLCLQPTTPLIGTNSCPFQTVWKPGLLADTAPEDLGLCKGPSILGREGPTAYPWQALPVGRKHVRAWADDGTTDYVHR